MRNKMKLLASMDSLVKEGMEIADSILSFTEAGKQPSKEQIHRIYALMRKVEVILGHDINLDKYPSLKANYTKWKSSLKKKIIKK